MKPPDYLGVVIRTAGLLLLLAGVYFTGYLLLLGIMYPPFLLLMIFPAIPGAAAIGAGLFLLRKAAALTRFCYPSRDPRI